MFIALLIGIAIFLIICWVAYMASKLVRRRLGEMKYASMWAGLVFFATFALLGFLTVLFIISNLQFQR